MKVGPKSSLRPFLHRALQFMIIFTDCLNRFMECSIIILFLIII